MTKLTTAARSDAGGGAGESSLIQPRIEWQVSADQLVERLCYWRHGSALARVGLTDVLKDCVTRKLEPPASKRLLTLVWWGMESVIGEALRNARAAADAAGETDPSTPPVITVCVDDILPVYEWEVDCLRERPRLKTMCHRMLLREHWNYRLHCNQLTTGQREFLEHYEIVFIPGSADPGSSCPGWCARRRPSMDDHADRESMHHGRTSALVQDRRGTADMSMMNDISILPSESDIDHQPSTEPIAAAGLPSRSARSNSRHRADDVDASLITEASCDDDPLCSNRARIVSRSVTNFPQPRRKFALSSPACRSDHDRTDMECMRD